MSGNDRNAVNIGPARVKVDDSIYDAVDQGIVTAATTTSTTTDTGFTPIGPIGDLITPPTLDPVTGYPITAAAINFSESQLYPLTPWAVLDLSALGSFTNALILFESNDLSIVNLDNPSQKTTYPGVGAKSWIYDFVVRDGALTWGFDVFAGGAWTNPTYVLPAGGSKTASQMESGLEPIVQDYTNRYFNIDNHYYKLPHTGSLAPVLIAASVGSPIGADTIAIAGTALWAQYVSGGTNRIKPIDTTTGATGPEVNITTAFNSGIVWGLTTTAVAGLKVTVSGGNQIFDLTLVDVYGGITTQANLMTLPDTYALQYVTPLPGADVCLAVFYDVATGIDHTYQISTAGYQAVTMPTERVRALRFSNANPSGFVRWWGSTQAGTGDALYEAAL